MTRPGQPLPGAVSGGVGDGERRRRTRARRTIRKEEVEDIRDQGRTRTAEKQV